MTKCNDFAGARQAAFNAVYDEYSRGFGVRFLHAWHYDTDPDLEATFLEALAHRLEGRSLREIGHALASSPPAGWEEDEGFEWVCALGSLAIRPVAERDRAPLIGIAHVLGLEARARSWGLRW